MDEGKQGDRTFAEEKRTERWRGGRGDIELKCAMYICQFCPVNNHYGPQTWTNQNKFANIVYSQ